MRNHFKFEKVVTGSADKTVKILDILSGFKTLNTFETSDAVFSLEMVYNLTVAGCGDGNIIVFDNDTGQCLYGFVFIFSNQINFNSFGAMSKGGIRCLKANDSFTKYACKYKAN